MFYKRYFVSLILTFQFHEALCRASNHTGPLHKCDIYNSKKAGEKLKNMMKKGSRVSWPIVLKEFTDGKSDRIDPTPMLEYFDPLLKWLRKQNLTDTDWDCDSYVNNATNTFTAYDSSSILIEKEYLQLFETEYSLAISINVDLICLIINLIAVTYSLKTSL